MHFLFCTCRKLSCTLVAHVSEKYFLVHFFSLSLANHGRRRFIAFKSPRSNICKKKSACNRHLRGSLGRSWNVQILILHSNLLSVLFLFAAIHSLHLTKINIPQYKFRGENAILECNYELNGRNYESDDDDDEGDMENSHSNNYHDANVEVETLYSIKW